MTRLDDQVARLKARGYSWPIAWDAVEMLARSEDCRLVAYLDVAGVPTIAWGETAGVHLDMRWTEDQCDARFYQQVVRYAGAVEAMLTAHANENELGALLRLAYNIGLTGLKKSTVLRQHNAGNKAAAARAFALWNRARDPATHQPREVRGLTARRASEAAMYLTPIEGAPRDPMPQAVEPESPLSASPIARGGAATVVAGSLTGGATLIDQLGDATGTLGAVKAFGAQVGEFIGLPPGAILAVVLIGAGYVVVKWRREQRRQGFA